ncbi:DUF2339 domain-containing protein [Flexithrix dorotheae]|uniref:DUF2339 domain-containing protein n=1 Tax=Flexithrix dorotheae TaxID=70993 RepID=UPI0003623F22|nr:DUF2339 domain-containing protein [Flexithrix dorotheae]
MTDNQDRINELLKRLELLSVQQKKFELEIEDIRRELLELKVQEEKSEALSEKIKPEPVQKEEIKPVIQPETPKREKSVRLEDQPFFAKTKKKKPAKSYFPKSDFEKFIGENLINKIGIIILVIGVAIGAKYSIDHDLISPLTRIVLGYISGIVLLGFGMKLKTKYENFSAVLVSGAMAIMYFITFAAYSFYDLFPQAATFALMVVFTAFTVFAALNYNRPVIAHFGLVGAYAVPFLLSDGSGKVAVLFSYMAIINVGILVIAFKKYWKSLYYAAFGLTWLIFIPWFLMEYNFEDHFALAITFLTIFFITFYVTFLAYKLVKQEKFMKVDILLILANSFIYYGIGFDILDNHTLTGELLGLFTLANALVHFAVGALIKKKKLGSNNLFYLVIGLVMVFITMAIPVQLDGNWVTLLWVGEAALLFWIGRTKNIDFYEKISYALMLLAFFSIFHDWDNDYGNYYKSVPESRITPLFNINFLTSMLFIAAFGFINWLNQQTKFTSPLKPAKGIYQIMPVVIPGILLIVSYFAFNMEIETYWDQLYIDSEIYITEDGDTYSNYYFNYDLKTFKSIWTIIYSLFFWAVLSFINLKKLKNRKLAIVNLFLNVLAIITFLTAGLYALSELRDSFISQNLAEYYHKGTFHIGIRYVSFVFLGMVLLATYQYVKQEFKEKQFPIAFDALMHISILWVTSSELINWLDLSGSDQAYKLGLSILWGVYALMLIALGIWKRKKHLRIGAIALFAITLIKLFFYDISQLDTISKTIVFVSLGLLLLIISFLYNKYKTVLSDEVEA